MAEVTTSDPWRQAVTDLAAWHTERRATAARSALAFIESELRLAIPPLVRRTWPEELVEDALREFLTRLLEHPLPNAIDDPRRYLIRSFRNRCIDLHRAQQRRHEVATSEQPGWEPPEPGPTAAERLEEQEQSTALRDALKSLPIADRVAVKLVDAPEWLDAVEFAWLVQRSGETPEAVRRAITAADEVFALTELFDPPVPGQPDDRRLRMERFRRRRGRARERLRSILQGGGVDA